LTIPAADSTAEASNPAVMTDRLMAGRTTVFSFEIMQWPSEGAIGS
jgi:hypothetical protein